MRIKLLSAVMIATLLYSGNAAAQQKHIVISGTVTSADESLPLEGATIAEKGTKNITGTMPDGQFALSVAPEDTIVVRFDGYETKEIKITGALYYQITLKHAETTEKLTPKIDSSVIF
jgi:TonB-dependent starch-binding outer membrane protein SusC